MGRNGIIQGYKVTYHSVGEWYGKYTVPPVCQFNWHVDTFIDNDDQQTKIINQLRTTISGLRKFTNYSITALAYTGSGDGVRSSPVYCQTEEDGKAWLLVVPHLLKPIDNSAIGARPNQSRSERTQQNSCLLVTAQVQQRSPNRIHFLYECGGGRDGGRNAQEDAQP